MTTHSTTTEAALEPTLEELAIQAATFLESAKLLQFNELTRAQQIAFALRSRIPAPSVAPGVGYSALHWQSKAAAEETMCGRLAKDVRCTVLSDFATCETCKAAAFGYQMGRADERVAAPASPVAPVEQSENARMFAPPAEDKLHIAICNAVQSDQFTASDILRQALIDYLPTKLTRTELIRVQQRSGSGEVSAIMVSPAPASPAARRDEAERVDDVEVVYPCVVDHKTLIACLRTAEQVFRKPDEPERCERFQRTKAKLFAQARATTTPPSTLAQAAADKIVPDCLSRTCFIRDCHRNHCWGCDDAKKERERVTAIIERCLSGGGEQSE